MILRVQIPSDALTQVRPRVCGSTVEQATLNRLVAGSNPVIPININAYVAQLVVRLFRNQKVERSSRFVGFQKARID